MQLSKIALHVLLADVEVCLLSSGGIELADILRNNYGFLLCGGGGGERS